MLKNTFMLPIDSSGKKYYDENTHLFNLLVKKIPYQSIALKLIDV